jgi:hypothetical protein
MLAIVVEWSDDFNPHSASYFGLIFFETIEEVADYISRETKCGYYVKDIYDVNQKMLTNYKVSYDVGIRSVSSVIISDKDDILFRIDRDPYDVTKKWKVKNLKNVDSYD